MNTKDTPGRIAEYVKGRDPDDLLLPAMKVAFEGRGEIAEAEFDGREFGMGLGYHQMTISPPELADEAKSVLKGMAVLFELMSGFDDDSEDQEGIATLAKVMADNIEATHGV